MVQFEDYSVKVKDALHDAAIVWLYECGMELEAQTKRNVPSNSSKWYPQQKNAWEYRIDEAKGECVVGNPLEAALWTEFGTGEYSISPKGGRKGYWIYVKDSSSSSGSYVYKGGKQYTLDEAKRIVAMMRDDGLDAHYTKGQTPKRPLFNAFNSRKKFLIRRYGQIMKERFNDN